MSDKSETRDGCTFDCEVTLRIDLKISVPNGEESSFDYIRDLAPGSAKAFVESAFKHEAERKGWRPGFGLIGYDSQPKVIEIRGIWREPEPSE